MADRKKYRRSNGEGSVFRHHNGKWCGQIALGLDEKGKRTRKTVYGDTRAEVVEKLTVLRGSIDAYKLRAGTKTTVGQFIEKWLKDFKRPTVTPRTYEWYVNVNKSVSQEVRDAPLHKVNCYRIQTMLNTMKNEGYSVRSVKAAFDLLNQAFKAAMEFRMIGENPMDRVRIQRKETQKKQKASR